MGNPCLDCSGDDIVQVMAEGFMAKIGTDIDEIHCSPVYCRFLTGLRFPVRQIESGQSLS